MSKKTAKSKGYRHYKKEKPFLTKKEIYALIVIVAVILVGFITFICYDDGALKIKDGRIDGLETNWIIANGGTSTSPRYFKLGEAGDLEGYTRLPTMSYTDYNLYDNYYYPTEETNPIDYISIGTTSLKNSTPAELGKTVVDTIATMEGYALTSPLTEAKAGDVPYSYYAFTTESYVEPVETEAAEVPAAEETTEATETADESAAAETAEETVEATEAAAEEPAATEAAKETAENAPNTFGQSMNAYVATAYDGCLMIHVVNETESPEDYLSDDELKAILEQVISAIEFEKK